MLSIDGAWKEPKFEFHYDFHDIAAVQLLDAKTGWAVGDAGYIFSFNGTDWAKVNSPTEGFLQDLWLISADDGWAVGNDGIILHYDGSTWNTLSSPTSNALWAIRMYGKDLGWIRGKDILLRYDGTKWANEKFPLKQGFYGWPVASASDDIWAITQLNGIVHFDGTSWKVLYLWPDVVK